jgi:uncharacterized protein YbjT (DUF2867 family)
LRVDYERDRTEGPVLVTGASGLIAGHCIRELLEHGYAVRGTVRSLAARDKVAHLHAMAEETGGSLELVEADLGSDQGWAQAVAHRVWPQRGRCNGPIREGLA